MSALWDLIQTHIDATGQSERAIARQAGITAQALNSWKHRQLRSLPHPSSLRAVARVINIPYDHVLGAALRDADYVVDDELPARPLLSPADVVDPKIRQALSIITTALTEHNGVAAVVDSAVQPSEVRPSD